MIRTMAFLLLTSCGLACGPALPTDHEHPTVSPAPAQECPAPRTHLLDLTQKMHPDMPVWPGGVPFKMTRLSDYEQGYRIHKFEMGENTGTHVDAPAHFIEGKRNIDQIPLDELVAPLVVVNVRDKVAKDPSYLIGGNDLVDWEAVHGPIPVGSVVVVNTGWHKRFEDTEKYINLDDQGVMQFPGYSAEAATLLVERDVVGAGIDTLSLDHGPSKDFAAHKVLLGANKYGIENLGNLDEVPETGATIIVGVLPVSEGSQAQARVLAQVPDEPEEEEGEEGEGEEEE